MRILSSPTVVNSADQIVKNIIRAYLEPNKTFPELRIDRSASEFQRGLPRRIRESSLRTARLALKVATGKRSQSFHGVPFSFPAPKYTSRWAYCAFRDRGSQHENGYGRVIEDRPGATAENFFSHRTRTIAAHDDEIGTTNLGRRRQQCCDWAAVGSDRSLRRGGHAMPIERPRWQHHLPKAGPRQPLRSLLFPLRSEVASRR
jgi:hypothetical protein